MTDSANSQASRKHPEPSQFGDTGSPSNDDAPGAVKETSQILSGRQNIPRLFQRTSDTALAAIDNGDAPVIVAYNDKDNTRKVTGDRATPGGTTGSNTLTNKDILQNIDNIIANTNRVRQEKPKVEPPKLPEAPKPAEAAKPTETPTTKPVVASDSRANNQAQPQTQERPPIIKYEPGSSTTGASDRALAEALRRQEQQKSKPESDQLKSPMHREIRSVDDARKLFEQAKRSGVPLVVDIGADWCGPCKTMENQTLKYLDGRAHAQNKPPINAIYAQVIQSNSRDPKVGLSTDRTEAIAKALGVKEVNGYPTVAVYGKANNYKSPIGGLSNVLSYQELARRIHRANTPPNSR